MDNGENAAREGLVETQQQQIGNHSHGFLYDDSQPLRHVRTVDGVKIYEKRRSIEPPCGICAAENDAFLELQRRLGSEPLENKMYYMPSYRAYNQKWPFDAREKTLSLEAVFEERADGQSTEPASLDRSILDTLLDDEATAEILSVLPEEQRRVMQYTVEGYKPREIAELKGDKNSARVRQDKYAAKRTLGAPINSRMRRGKHE